MCVYMCSMMVCQATSDQQRRGYGFEESPQEHGRAAERYGASRVLQQAFNQLIHPTSHSRYLQQKQCIIFFHFGWNGDPKVCGGGRQQTVEADGAAVELLLEFQVILLGVKMYMLTTFEAKIVKQKRMTATHSAG